MDQDSARLDELVVELLGRLEDDGTDALEELCARHPDREQELRSRVEVLRRAGFLRTVEGERETIPERLGDFRLLNKLGSGGMGVVYAAEQMSLGRTVALKLIRPDQLYFPESRARFLREVEAVARLSHPGIVAVHTVGLEAGIPYFAMEHVAGATLDGVLTDLAGRSPEPLTGADLHASVLRRAGLDSTDPPGPTFEGGWTEACLRIVRQAAEALEYAHRRGVLHRDIKPSNLILTPDGRALVFDFGLAHREGASRLTRTGSMLGSLPYMSPEVSSGGQTTGAAATDVYSLGVTLYELLALRLPYMGGSTEELARMIDEGRPAPLRKLNPSVSRDVETVCATAMEADPARRYPSAEAFAQDLTNLLEDRPIAARRSGPVGLAVRWARRRPSAAAALALALLVVVGGPIAYGLQQSRARSRIEAESRRAEANFERALAAVEGMLSRVALETLDDVPRFQVVRRDLLDDASRLYEELLRERPTSFELRSRRAEVQRALGDARLKLGETSAAEEAYQLSVDEYRALIGAAPADLRLLHSALVASNALANLHQLRGEDERARLLYEQALDLAAASGALADSEPLLAIRATVTRNLARLHADAGRRDEAEEAYRAAIEAGERLCAEHGRTAAHADVLAGALLGYADALHGPTGEVAVALLERALALQLEVEDEDPDHLQTLGEVYLNLGSAVASTGRVEAALEIFDSGLERFERVAADFPEVPAFTSLYTDLLVSTATARSELHHDPDEVIETMQTAVEIKRALAAAHPEVVDYAYRLSLALNNLAVAHFFRGDSETCRQLSAESEQQARRAIAQGPGEPSHVRALDMAQACLAELRLQDGEHAAAAALLDEIEGRGLDEAFGHRNLGEGYARCASLARVDDSLSAAARAELAERHIVRGIDHLARAVELGYDDVEMLEEAVEFEALRSSPYFADVVEAARRRTP